MNLQFSKEQIEHDDIAKRYVQGQLSSEENIAFEEYLMEYPEMLDQLQLDQVFMDAMGEVDVLKANSVQEKRLLGVVSGIKWLCFGAIGAYASVAMFSFFNTTNTMMNVERVIYVDTVRSSDPVQKRIALADKNEKMVLMLSAGFDEKGPFDVSIIKVDSQKVIAEFKAVPKTETDDIAIVVDSELFGLGRYEFVVEQCCENSRVRHLVEMTR